MKITSTELAADNCKDQEKICGRIICNTKCVGRNMVLSSGTKNDPRKLSEKVTSVNINQSIQKWKIMKTQNPHKNGKERDTRILKGSAV